MNLMQDMLTTVHAKVSDAAEHNHNAIYIGV